MQVPFLDLKAQYHSIENEVKDALEQVLAKTAFAGGPFVKSFEQNYAAFCQTSHAFGVGSGTESLWIALMGLGIGPGDEVISVPNTFIATLEAISFTGAKPVLVDIDPENFLMNPDLIEAAITDKTKAIIPVHLYGQMADMDPILAIAKKYDLKVVEDACQAHGATYHGKQAGSLGDAGCFSFYPGKNLGAYGEAGGIVTSSQDLANYIAMFRDHGQPKKYHHDIVGWNGRMDGFQGAILDVKLKHIQKWNQARAAHAEMYNELLSGVGEVTTPVPAGWGMHVFHVYSLRAKNRDALMDHLNENGVACGIHYPVSLHLTEAYADLGNGKGSFPEAEKAADEIVSLPMFPELTEQQIRYVVQQIKDFYTS